MITTKRQHLDRIAKETEEKRNLILCDIVENLEKGIRHNCELMITKNQSIPVKVSIYNTPREIVEEIVAAYKQAGWTVTVDERWIRLE